MTKDENSWYMEFIQGFLKHKEYVYTSSEAYEKIESPLKTLSLFLLVPFFVFFAFANFFALFRFNECETGHHWDAHYGFLLTILVLAIYEKQVYEKHVLNLDHISSQVSHPPRPDPKDKRLGRNFVYRHSGFFFLLAGILFKIDFYTDLCFVVKLFDCRDTHNHNQLIFLLSASSLCLYGLF